jgi:AcrR family transcriptional regulator
MNTLKIGIGGIETACAVAIKFGDGTYALGNRGADGGFNRTYHCEPSLELRAKNVYSDNMIRNADTVNLENENKAFHHGDLRAALIRAGLDLLETQLADGLSLREIARKVGVSPTAVYRHFPNKQSLLYALCAHGADGLYAAQATAMAAAGGGLVGFAETGKAYVRYAIANPTLFRLLMATRPPNEARELDSIHVSAAMRLLSDNVASLVPPGTSPQTARIVVALTWSKVHGMAMLMLDGQIPVDETLIDAISLQAPFLAAC